MRIVQKAKAKSWRRAGLAAVAAFSIFSLAGCRTSDDANAAATQMSDTAKALSDYYSALSVMLEKTDRLYTLESELYGVPYADENRKLVLTEEAELGKRVQLAEDFSNLAAEFAKLTGSTAPDDVAASAAKLQDEVTTLASVQASSLEQAALKDALTLLVTAVKEHKERKAASAIDGFAKGMNALFVKEEPVWKSTEQVYSHTASRIANELVDHKSVDDSAVIPTALAPALDPFDMQPLGSSDDLNAKLPILAKHQIATKSADMDNAFQSATHAMEQSLEEMSRRVHAVAEDKPMGHRTDPVTLADVLKWVKEFSSL